MKVFDDVIQKADGLLAGLPCRRYAFDAEAAAPLGEKNELVLQR